MEPIVGSQREERAKQTRSKRRHEVEHTINGVHRALFANTQLEQLMNVVGEDLIEIRTRHGPLAMNRTPVDESVDSRSVPRLSIRLECHSEQVCSVLPWHGECSLSVHHPTKSRLRVTIGVVRVRGLCERRGVGVRSETTCRWGELSRSPLGVF